MTTYYNDNDLHAAQWTRNLIVEGIISNGVVDDRSIKEVKANDLNGYERAHFFSGISGWDYALSLAGWPEGHCVWSGSAPCQPFSIAGKQKGTDDERHLWPEFFRLIGECRPPVIFGEQVASKDGRAWWDIVAKDLESIGYFAYCTDIPAAAVAAPHKRQRLYWCAILNRKVKKTIRLNSLTGIRLNLEGLDDAGRSNHPGLTSNATIGQDANELAVSEYTKRRTELQIDSDPYGRNGSGRRRNDDALGDSDQPGRQGWSDEPGECTSECALGASSPADLDALQEPERRSGPYAASQFWDNHAIVHCAVGEPNCRRRPEGQSSAKTLGQRSPIESTSGFWDNYTIVHCADGKARRIESGSEPLVAGLPFKLVDGRTRKDASRAKILKGIGNSICAPLAVEFIKAVMEYLNETSV